ncbi:MAG: DnaJ domain-containing protein [Dehalococcoidia bacterium]|nr:DnaJ domain-containing protein [Dehalococcoidia bacterium]
MAEATLVDYYAALNLPHNADLTGIENAYARLSDELAVMGEIDEGCREALQRINEAYGVLSKPELRRSYDAVFLAEERADQEHQVVLAMRRRLIAQRLIVAALGLIVAAQAAGLAYLGRNEISDIMGLIR